MTPAPTDVERVARAMAFSVKQPNDASSDADEYWHHTGEHGRATWMIAARAAIAAMQPIVADSFQKLINEGVQRGQKAMIKFPQPNYVISKFSEEAGEVVKAAIHCAEGREPPENVIDEMRDAIGMMYRLWVEGDQVHGLRALSKETPDDNA
jgi:phosphoribosyl-ATP pyrophosphohydrolase